MACKLTKFAYIDRENGDNKHCHNNGHDYDRTALVWSNLSYYKKSVFGKKSSLILNQLKGHTEFGRITALMGPSGCGKTTLLRCINGVKRNGLNDESKIYVNKDKLIRPCFVVQDIEQHLLMGLSVRESLKFAYLLKNSVNVCKELSECNTSQLLQKNLILKLVNDLMLNDCIDTVINRCSGGEKKRVVIAMELTSLQKPNLLCIDEPTTGLDSYSAQQIVECLRTITRKHLLSTVMSIHQPNSDILMLFDSVYVLAKGGACVYSGPPIAIRDHLQDCQIQCREHQTPIEVLIKISSLNSKSKNFENCDSIIRKLAIKANEKLIPLDNYIAYNKESLIKHNNDLKAEFNLKNLWYLLCRSMFNRCKSQWVLLLISFFIDICLSLFLCAMYSSDLGLDSYCLNSNSSKQLMANTIETRSESKMFQNIKVIYCIIISTTYIALLISEVFFIFELKLFLIEHRNHWYSSLAFYLAQTIIQLPILIISNCIFVWIVYYGTSQADMHHWYNCVYDIPERFGLVVLVSTLSILHAQGLAFLVAIVFIKRANLALIFVNIILLFCKIFNGFVLPKEKAGHLIEYISYFSYTKLGFDSFLIIIYGRSRCDSDNSWPMIMYDLNDDQLWHNIYWFLANIFVWRLIALILLIRTSRKC